MAWPDAHPRRDDAAKFLQATVNVRHTFAHQDKHKKIDSVIGMAQARAAGGSNVGSHHAQNAVGGVLQLAVLTAHGLARQQGMGEKFPVQEGDAGPGRGTRTRSRIVALVAQGDAHNDGDHNSLDRRPTV